MTLNRYHLIKSLAVVLVVWAVAVPAASARVNLTPQSPGPTFATQVEPAPPQTITVVKSSGFDWADAGVGAGAVVLLTLTGLGAWLIIGRRRQFESSAARSTISAA